MRNIIYLLVMLFIASCSKDDPSDFIWEKSLGSGSAYDTKIFNDSLFLIAGIDNNDPIFIKTGKGSAPDINYSPLYDGAYTSVIYDTSGYYLAGSSNGKLLLAKLGLDGAEKWDTLIDVASDVHITKIAAYNSETMIAVGSDNPDSLNSSSYSVILFDRLGQVQELNTVSPGFKPSVTDLIVLPTGEIFISITKNSGGEKSKASVARITLEGLIIWETELSNNQNFGAGSLALKEEGGSIYVSGRTELTVSDGVLMNSFASSLTLGGMVNWKIYLESSNSGTDLGFDSNMNLVILNRNCLVLNFIPLPDGDSDERMRVLDVCDSYDTNIYGYSISVTESNNYFIGGSKGGKFYYALRSANTE